jgi:pimeloyl-ACP methyl ester carboxylesterase
MRGTAFANRLNMRCSLMKAYAAFAFAFLLLAGCNDDSSENSPKAYSKAEFLDNLTASELKLLVANSGYDIPVEEFQYNVNVYKVVYPTTYKDEKVQASGLVILPETSNAIGMVSFQHGTISLHADAPSAVSISHYSRYLYGGLSSPGFIAVVPDFLGFGESDELMHPYYVEELSATSVVDLLIAAKALANDKGINFNGNVSLAGYSEGGYVTMATHKWIEENGLEGFNLLGSYPAAGGFDVKAMQEYLFSQENYSQPFYIAYVAESYRTTYDWTQPLNEFFEEPYATEIPSLFDGSKSGSQINSELTTNIPALLNDELVANLETDSKYSYIHAAFTENSLTDWTPTIQMHMYHGDADDTVPYENSVTTYNKLIANGASETTVQLHILPGADHAGGIQPYLEDIIPRLLATR